ncbi:hypothetical protein PIROE2DRAFT_14694 [Piromyces sp. E2]|nr:hypothetical protein PIROE2DRAFT_14694 [Piromyces sp. E2]|eukprot:OUM59694.1 hypothetical protein PIROE2DRAFT_14694 [Piromyces sp. E2]
MYKLKKYSKVYGTKQRYSPRRHRIEREALKQFEAIVNYGNGKDIHCKSNQNKNGNFLINDPSFLIKIKKGCIQHEDPNTTKHTIYINNTIPNNHSNKPITVNLTEDGEGNANLHISNHKTCKSPTFHQKLNYIKDDQTCYDHNIPLTDPMYLQDGNYIDLSEFKTYLINYGKKYGMQKLKNILHEQFFKRVKIISDNKQNLNESSKTKENSFTHSNTDSSEEQQVYGSVAEISITSTDLLNELEQEIENGINKTDNKSFLNNKDDTIARCTSFTETDVPYEDPTEKKYPEMLTLPKNNYSAPPPSTLILQCCPSPHSKKNSNKNITNSTYHPQFDRKAKEELLKKKFKNNNLYDSINLSHNKYEQNSSGSESEYSESGDDSDNDGDNDDDDDERDSYRNSNSESSSSDEFSDKILVDPYEIMNYKVQMFNNKRKFNIEKSKANEKIIEGKEEYPIFKDFLYPRWYQHQRYYTNENGYDLRSINGLYGINLSDSEDDGEGIKDVYIDNETLKKIIERKNNKERFISINDDNNSQFSEDSFDIDPQDQILKEIEIVKKELINLRRKNKMLWNNGHPRQGNFHYPTRDESIRHWNWKNRHPENAGKLS